MDGPIRSNVSTPMTHRLALRLSHAVALLLVVAGAVAGARQNPGGQATPGTGPQPPARDNPAQTTAAPTPAGHIAGRVLASDNGRPVKRARVFINAAELPGGRGVLTDDMGLFDFAELPAGRYTLTVSKSGFVSLSYGQRRPLQAGTPLQLADGQQLRGIEFQLPRGSVIAGHIFDEDGDPMPGVLVRVMRYEYQQGDRRLVPAGTAQTDDKGQYRVWGLLPGDYYVNAQARLNLNFGGRGGPGGAGGPGGGRGGPGGGGFAAAMAGRMGNPQLAALLGSGDDDQRSYAPTYFPGVSTVNEARPIALGLSQEALDNDFSLQLIRVAKVSGRVTNPDGSPTTAGQVSLLPDGSAERGGQFGLNYMSRIDWDGSFGITNVPPGRYLLRARSDDTVQPQFASVPLTISDVDASDVTVILSAGASISGSVVFPPGLQAPDPTSIRITAPSTEQQLGNQSQARVEKDGSFTIDAVPAGPHLIRPNGGMRGWTLRSVTADGRDITDVPVDLRTGQRLTNVTVTFTDKVNEINGVITNDRGVPVTEYTVLAFSTDPSFWRPQSRQVATARPDQTGKYTLRTLPPGEYYLTTVDPTQQGEWFQAAYLDEHRSGAVRVNLAEGDTRVHDFTVRSEK